MGTVHDLIETKGRRGALEAGIERPIVEAAAAYLSDEDAGLGFAYSGWAQCALPHKRLADDAPWGTVSEKVRLMVEPGRRQRVALDGSQSFEFVGVPFGSHARLILLYLQTEALRTGSREVELGGSMRAWLFRVGIPAGGTTGKSVRDQAERISRCKLTFDITTGSRSYGLVQQTIVDKALFIEADEGTRQGRLSLETAKLSEGFFEQLQKHPVPLEEAAIKALSNTPPRWTPISGLPTAFTSYARTSWSPGRRSNRNSGPASRSSITSRTSSPARWPWPEPCIPRRSSR
jgi:hypothetical protein